MGRLTNVIRIRASPWPNRPALEFCSLESLGTDASTPFNVCAKSLTSGPQMACHSWRCYDFRTNWISRL